MDQVNNHDVVFVNDKLRRYIAEAQLCVSSNVSIIRKFDEARLLVYLSDLDAAIIWIMAQPQLDLPETAPTVYDLADMPDTVDTENEAINQIVRLLTGARTELVNAQSARLPAGLMAVDADRFTAMVDKTRKLITEYVQAMPVLDLPESSPQEPVTPPGELGTLQA